MRGSRTAALAGVALLACVAYAPPARACGGLFCNANLPVNQTAERIVFSQNGDGTVTAIVEIVYSGPSESFAWVLPVPGTPDVGVSSTRALSQLQLTTNPTYTLNTTVEGSCRVDDLLRGPSAGGGFFDAAASAADAGLPPVTVVDSGTVGPYDYVTISLDPMLPSPGDVAVGWLQDNGYDVDDFARDRLGPYLTDGMNLIAFRLTKSSSTGSIRPIVMTYTTAMPMIPIRPTAVAAERDMGVLVWVLGEARAVPANYRSLVLNEALINWFNAAPTYDDVVVAAADEAGGQGFVTEMAACTDTLTPVFVEGQGLDAIRARLIASMESSALAEVIGLYAGWDGLRDAVTRTVPIPDEATVDDVLRCPACVFGPAAAIEGFDTEAFLDAVEADVIEPMRRTQEILGSRPYFTRLYTTLSPDEMTVDPMFDFNPQLGDVSNAHVANRVIECSPRVTQAEAPWRVELASGDVVRGSGSTWPFAVGDGSPLPANRRVEQLGPAGMGDVVTDNAASISTALDAHNETVPGPPSASIRGGCAVRGRDATPAAVLALSAFAALLGRRRRRR